MRVQFGFRKVLYKELTKHPQSQINILIVKSYTERWTIAYFTEKSFKITFWMNE